MHRTHASVNEKNDFYILSQERLGHVIELIKQRKIVALDTEFTRQKTYYPILSIIQIAVRNSVGKKESFIVDCLTDLDLSGLFAVIADEKIIKILHSSSQDLQIFYQESGKLPCNIFDTQILANFCGLGFNVGYSHLIQIFFGKKLSKQQQRSDWQRRPLNQKQIKYALFDVFYLEEIYEKLLAELSTKNRLSWYQEEITNFSKKLTDTSKENLLKKFSLHHKSPRQISQIQNLIFWRENWARKLNIPRQHFMSNEEIEDVITKDLGEINFGKKITQKMIEEISLILSKEDEMVRDEILLNQQQKLLLNRAKKLIARISEETNLREQFLVTNSELKKIVSSKDPLKEVLTGWRYELIGDQLNNLVNL